MEKNEKKWKKMGKKWKKKVKCEGKNMEKIKFWCVLRSLQRKMVKNGEKKVKNVDFGGKSPGIGSLGLVWCRWRGNFGVLVLGNGEKWPKNG